MSAKELIVKPISRADANRVCQKFHYSGKIVPNSQLHLGVFFRGVLEGVMQFGPSMDKRKTIGIVRDTPWNGFLELNRMAFGPRLPRNSESRALAVAFRLIKKQYPHIQWIISFSDGCQCGDGTIYRAAGFILTGIKRNKTILRMPDGTIIADKTLNDSPDPAMRSGAMKAKGAKPLEGFQLRYLYFIDKTARSRLMVDEIPFSEIERVGASMYLGQRRAGSSDGAASGFQSEEGGSNPTPALQSSPDEVST